jgi:hypothetical protein
MPPVSLKIGNMKKQFFKKANLIEILNKPKKKHKKKLSKSEIVNELLLNKDNLICSICNKNRARINEKKAKIIPCEECVYLRNRLKIYKLTVNNYKKLLEKQNYKCAICNNFLSLSRENIDHCHRNDHVRGILCSNCNMILGLAHDNVAKLISACKYLISNRVKLNWCIQDEKAVELDKLFRDGELVGWEGLNEDISENLLKFAGQTCYTINRD